MVVFRARYGPGVSRYFALRWVGLWMSMQYDCSLPPPSTLISNRPAETELFPLLLKMVAE
ncbi:hypothetical protein SCALM49S_05020 [Streptomyces californicus]